jgi:hypothetical protein
MNNLEVHRMSLQARGIFPTRLPFLLLSFFLLIGCGSSGPGPDMGTGPDRPQALSGIHPPGWVPSGHAAQGKTSVQSCTDCHANDFTGGTANVACNQCHLGNEQAIHPVLWGRYAYALHATYVELNGTSTCATGSCHGIDLAGVPGSGPSCVQCHMGGINSAHPVGWKNNILLHKDYVGSNGSSSCRTSVCHGPDLKGVFLSGPSCGACHPWAG